MAVQSIEEHSLYTDIQECVMRFYTLSNVLEDQFISSEYQDKEQTIVEIMAELKIKLDHKDNLLNRLDDTYIESLCEAQEAAYKKGFLDCLNGFMSILDNKTTNR
ncbi:hypothetical protein EEL30_00360 (plasmid) [Brevibacillus laterosporus]|uniref:Uncharacterized protein n=1 Tax=Brevibacillus laterosporus TaxID=1465 RepID=A0A518V1V3_BRELA|nr:hypothetical protein EEL30_00360 [Brevibacillus laterosporus]